MERKRLLISGFLILTLHLCSSTSNDIVAAPNQNARPLEHSYRLDDRVKPIDYSIFIRPYFEHEKPEKVFTFDGYVIIRIQVLQAAVTNITVHRQLLDIQRRFIEPVVPNSDDISIESTAYDDETMQETLVLNKALQLNAQYDLTLDYTGSMEENLQGLHRMSYVENNSTKWLASTQMEPIYARRVFPCFDEPHFKSRFRLTVDRPPQFQPTLSNTPQISPAQEIFFEGQTFIRERFAETPLMPTYLVAFIMSEFQCRDNEQKTFQVCARPDKFDATEYAFSVGPKILAQLEQLLDSPYASADMPKLTLAAVPSMEMSAMENWGLAIFREEMLLVGSEKPAKGTLKRVATTIAHELAHMWFGNLVTCDWWDNTWLNEGFAHFFTYFVTELVETDWKLEEAFVLEQLHTVFRADDRPEARAISHKVNAPKEILGIFNLFSYSKGASIIRMLQHAVGDSSFAAGLRKYLKTRAGQTAVPTHVYDALQSTTSVDLNISKFMDTWILQKSYPVLELEFNEKRTAVNLTQWDFTKTTANGSASNSRWDIPINYAWTKGNDKFTETSISALFPSEQNELVVDFAGPVDWIIFNVKQTGYYRVNYDTVTFNNIIDVLSNSIDRINVINRAQLVDDTFSLAFNGHMPYDRAFRLFDYLKHETDPTPWLAAVQRFDKILNHCRPSMRKAIQTYIIELIDGVYRHIGFDDVAGPIVGEKLIFNARDMLSHACRFGHPECIAAAKKAFDNYRTGTYVIPDELKVTVMCHGIYVGSAADWLYVWADYENQTENVSKGRFLQALGCTVDAKLITIYLDNILSHKVPLIYKRFALLATVAKAQNVDLVLDYLINDQARINEMFQASEALGSILYSMASHFTKAEQTMKLLAITYPFSPAILQLALKESEASVKWNSDNIGAIERIIESKVLGNPDDSDKPNDGPIGPNSGDVSPHIKPDGPQGSNSPNGTSPTGDPQSSNNPNGGAGDSSGLAGDGGPNNLNSPNSQDNANAAAGGGPDKPTAPAALTSAKSGLADLSGTTIVIIAGSLIGAALFGVVFVRLLTRNHWSHDRLASNRFDSA